ncbi:hypothetical protein V8C42DRAFT_354322 [Trichoderma barbatum]
MLLSNRPRNVTAAGPVRHTQLNTSFQDDFTIHHHDDSDDENDSRSTLRSEYWQSTEHIGRGVCGDVWLQKCVHGRRDYDRRAVKVIPQLKLKDKKDSYMTELEVIAMFLQKLYSKCFVNFLGWYDTDSDIYINYMTKYRPIDEANARETSFQPPRSKWWVKISDFGVSKCVEGSIKVMSSIRPSSLTLIKHHAADMWALGEMVYRILTQAAAFPTQNALVNYLVNTDLFPLEKLGDQGASSDAGSFISSLMGPPMEHAWVASLRSHRTLGPTASNYQCCMYFTAAFDAESVPTL